MHGTKCVSTFSVVSALARANLAHQMDRFYNPLHLSHMSIWEKTCLKRMFVFEGHSEGDWMNLLSCWSRPIRVVAAS